MVVLVAPVASSLVISEVTWLTEVTVDEVEEVTMFGWRGLCTWTGGRGANTTKTCQFFLAPKVAFQL